VSLRAQFIALILVAVAWTTREIPGFGYLPLADDDVNIFFNPHMGAPGASTLHWMASDLSYVHRYMPLGWLGFSLVYSASGLDPEGYHAADILLHAANAVLLFLVLEQLLRRFAAGAPDRDRTLAAGLAALLWALHPLRVETTAWCSGLLYSQSGFFALLCVYCRLAELRARSQAPAGRPSAWFAAALVSSVASSLTYPVALFLPFCVPIIDRAWLAGETEAMALARRAARREALALAITAVGALALAVNARDTVTTAWGQVPSLAQFGVLSRALQAAYVAAVYLWRTICPADVAWMPLTLYDPGSPGILGWIAAALLAAISAAALASRKRAPAFAACWACYLILVVPSLGLNEHPHTIVDRYVYFTSIAFAAALAAALVGIRPGFARVATRVACALAVVACALSSVGQARVWRDIGAFQRHMMLIPDPDLRHITAARTGKLRFLEGDVRGGREAVRLELERAPDVGGVILTWRQVMSQAPLSPEVASRKLQEWPAAPFSCVDLQIARIQVDEGRTGDALLHLDAAVARSPNFTEARFRRGLLLAAAGRPREALHDLLLVERPAAGRAPVSRALAQFMTEAVANGFEREGNGREARSVRLDWRRNKSGMDGSAATGPKP
jgi:hypothetical protein